MLRGFIHWQGKISLLSDCKSHFLFSPDVLTAPTTELSTKAPCTGNIFDEVVCQERNRTDRAFCETEPSWIELCCEFCGQEVGTVSSARPGKAENYPLAHNVGYQYVNLPSHYSCLI